MELYNKKYELEKYVLDNESEIKNKLRVYFNKEDQFKSEWFLPKRTSIKSNSK